MIALDLIGIGTGNPDHLTRAAIAAMNAADLILLPRKGDRKSDLIDLRRAICAEMLTTPTSTRIVEFDLPQRDEAGPYRVAVDRWHDAIARVWTAQIGEHLPRGGGRVALLVWGDPSLYDSSLRIAARLGAGGMALTVRVIPGITSLQALTAAHAIPLNDIAAPVLITTGRRLRDTGWPDGIDTLAVMLDGGCAFTTLVQEDVTIWWGAYLGMPHEALIAGPLLEAGPAITRARARLRADHGWIMDTYLLRRGVHDPVRDQSCVFVSGIATR